MYRGHEKHVIARLLAGVLSTSFVFLVSWQKGVLSNMCPSGLLFVRPLFSMASSPAKEASVEAYEWPCVARL